MQLQSQMAIYIDQERELGELFGFETRNKYSILGETGGRIGFAAEQQKGVLGFFSRQFLGHWRSFDIHVFDNDRRPVFIVHHPFRFLWQRLEVTTSDGKRLGFVQQRFGILRKRFDVEDPHRLVIFQMRSALWKPWTFPLFQGERQVAVILKRWSGLLREAFTDADRFQIEFTDSALTEAQRQLVLAAGLFVDLQYFERKASSRRDND